MTVDGHEFVVTARPGEPDVYDVEWLTGPAGYGFTVASSDRSAMGQPEAEKAIRDFLAQVDPATGHIE